MYAAIKRTAEDRVKAIDYDASGRTERVTSGAVFYYSNGELGLAQPELIKEYSPLGDCVSEARLISPEYGPKQFTWFDHCHRIIATVNEENFMTRYERNAAGKRVLKTEFATALTLSPTLDMSVAALDTQIKLPFKIELTNISIIYSTKKSVGR